jgi:outer membrane protein
MRKIQFTTSLPTRARLGWRPLAALVLLSAWATGAQAQDKWDLQRCIDYAWAENLPLKISKIQQDINQSNLLQSKIQRLPNLNAGAGQQWNQGRSVDQFTNQFTNQQVANFNAQLSLGATLFNGFRQLNTIKQNKSVLEASQFDVEQAKNDLALNIATTYLTILLNRELLNTARLQLQNTQEQLDRTLRLIEAGSLAEANKYDILSQKANNENQITIAENNVEIATVRLKILLQLPIEAQMEIVVPTLADPNPADVILLPSEVFAIAQTNQPNVLGADKSTTAAQYGIDLARGNAYPTLSFFGGFTSGTSSQFRQVVRGEPQVQQIGFLTNNPTQTVSSLSPSISQGPVLGFGDQFDQNLRNNFGFQLQIPIFNRFQIKNAVSVAKFQHQRAQLQAQNLRNTLRQTIEQAYADARAAQRAFISNVTRVDALTQSLQVVEQRFNAGAANSLDYALARNNLNIAQSDLIRSKFDYIFRTKVLDFYAGKGLKL